VSNSILTKNSFSNYKGDIMQENLVGAVTAGGFGFGHVPITDDFDTENMIGIIAVDDSGSISPFATDIENMLKTVTQMNQSLPTKNKIMQRVTKFGDCVEEVHGIQPVDQIDVSKYTGVINAGGMTALRDAVMDALEVSEKFCGDLIKQDYDATACIFVITDGCENNSAKCRSNAAVKAKIDALRVDEYAFTSQPIIVLIGINVKDPNIKAALDTFSKECGIDKFIAMEDVTKSSLGKLAGLISQSFSSKSQLVKSKNVSQQVSQITI
jgi:hypothetical protein